MILVDLNQTMISNLMMHLSYTKDNIVDEEMLRHMILNSLRSYRSKFYQEYGELVICCDAQNYWRRSIFPHYKASRKKSRDSSGLDWNTLFEALNKIRDEIRDHLPYKVIRIDRCEADDVIAAICHKYGRFLGANTDKILILSGDKDFGQLQKYCNVYQYAPVQKKMIAINNPESFRKEHIMLGDRSDGVPNFISDDDTFVVDKRQKPLRRDKIAEWSRMEPEQFCSGEMLRGYKRNQMLIDLDMIPEDLQKQCISEFESANCNDRSKIFNYFIQNRLGSLTESISDF
jgi:hypothetical protein